MKIKSEGGIWTRKDGRSQAFLRSSVSAWLLRVHRNGFDDASEAPPGSRKLGRKVEPVERAKSIGEKVVEDGKGAREGEEELPAVVPTGLGFYGFSDVTRQPSNAVDEGLVSCRGGRVSGRKRERADCDGEHT